MDEFYLLLIFIVGSATAIIFYLFPWLELRTKRERYRKAKQSLERARLQAPDLHEGWYLVTLHERQCDLLRDELLSLGVDPFDAIKPF